MERRGSLYGVAAAAALLLLLPMAAAAGGEAARLSPEHYRSTCPGVESVVRSVVARKVKETFVTVPATLRLFFHDCFVEHYSALGICILAKLTNFSAAFLMHSGFSLAA
ncbi:hypothetical protein OsI_31971 [Oryza sativa Indica Group]|uniref:Plant heme peroxidase family profile domain-containing protein n=1 Tax=Oryza sativa subsp. indica TaxID=39946 RepID=A2Z2X7_ORYSI|nr:hypothetical protein OsI_31971 [Oryza sativa Indica Group]